MIIINIWQHQKIKAEIQIDREYGYHWIPIRILSIPDITFMEILLSMMVNSIHASSNVEEKYQVQQKIGYK